MAERERWSRSWEETHAPGVELYRHFFQQLFESESISTPGQLRVVAASALGMLMSVGFLFTQSYYHKYLQLNALLDGEPYRLAFLADLLFIVTLAMVVMGLFATVLWPSLFPGLRDYLALAALPLRLGEIFAAKFMALFVVAGGAAFAVALLPSGILSAVATGVWADPGTFQFLFISVPKQLIALPVAAWLGAMFVFLSLVALQGVLLSVLPVRQFSRISLAVQALLLSVSLASLTLVISIPGLYRYMNMRPEWGVWAPPLWFLGIDRVIAGHADPYTIRLAWTGFFGIAGAAGITMLTYLWSYKSNRRRVLESPNVESTAPRLWPAAATARFIPGLPQLGVFAFIAKTLGRSRQHRLILTAFVAGGIAMIFEGFLTLAVRHRAGAWLLDPGGSRQAALGVPLALSLFVLGGLRYLFRLPVELRANWIFRIHEPGQGNQLLEGMEMFLWYGGLLPVAVLTLALECAVFGAAQGAVATVLCIGPALILCEALLFAFERIPFTSSYLPGRRPFIETAVLYTVFASAYVFGLASIFRYSLETNSAMPLAAVLLATWWWARRVRFKWGRLEKLEFEELPEPAVLTLGIDRD